jgi:Uri superfamily endonuclease
MIFSGGKNHVNNTGVKGSYLLVLRLKLLQRIAVGSLGRICFPAGYYVYVGSAQGPGGLGARVGRHLRTGKPLRWHIDYLREKADVCGIWVLPGPENREHEWAFQLQGEGAALVPAVGFGASDCCCAAHLFYFSRPPAENGRFDRLAGGPVPIPGHGQRHH